MDSADISKLLPLVAKAVKISQELPSSNTPAYVYYNDFPQYKAIAAGQSRKVLSIVQNVLDLLDARTNVVDMPSCKVHRDKFDSIVDANDRLLERLSVSMDLEEDPGRKSSVVDTNLVVATHRMQSTSLKWLKSKVEGSSNSDEPSDGVLSLLSSPNICRPQSQFSVAPDNSPTPFKPKLINKPNGICPLPDTIVNGTEDATRYPHPYEAELEQFASQISDWKPPSLDELKPKPMDSDYDFVNQVDQLNKVIEELRAHREVAVDLEHHNFRSYLGLTCLIQMTTRDKDYIIDALALRDHLQKLNEVFTDPNIIKVFHGSDQDLMWLQRDFSVYVVNLFDSHQAARALQLGRHSLSYLLQRYVEVSTNKRYQLADWRIRPLPEALVEYARTDTHYLLYIAAVMCQELQDRGLLQLVLERSRQLCLKCYEKPVFDPVGYLRLYKQAAGISFTHRQLYALEHLYALRDSIARREDESVHYVLPDHMLKVIAEVLPRESSGLFACCNPIPPLVRKYVHDLHKIVLDARNRPIDELPLTTAPEADQPNKQSQIASAAGKNVPPSDQFVPALPHDRSHSVTDLTQLPHQHELPAPKLKKPSALGEVVGLGRKAWPMSDLVDPQYEKKWLSRILDANRMLLTKLLTLLKAPVVIKEPESKPDSKAINKPIPPIPTIPSNQTRQVPPETLIKLDMDDSTNQRNSTKTESKAAVVHKVTKTTAPQKPIIPDSTMASDGTAQPEEQPFDPDEVVVLREETVGRNKRKRKRASLAATSSEQPADLTGVLKVEEEVIRKEQKFQPAVASSTSPAMSDAHNRTDTNSSSPLTVKQRSSGRSDIFAEFTEPSPTLKSPRGGRGKARRGKK